LLFHAIFPLQFWDDTFVTTCHLINHMPTPALK
jgi:hypothetical protein